MKDEVLTKWLFFLHKKWSFPLPISSVNVTKLQETANLVTFTEEIDNGKLRFLRSVPALTHIKPILLSCKNQSVDLHWKSVDWLLYESKVNLMWVHSPKLFSKHSAECFESETQQYQSGFSYQHPDFGCSLNSVVRYKHCTKNEVFH